MARTFLGASLDPELVKSIRRRAHAEGIAVSRGIGRTRRLTSKHLREDEAEICERALRALRRDA